MQRELYLMLLSKFLKRCLKDIFAYSSLRSHQYKQCRIHITRKNVCYILAETNRDQEVFFPSRMSVLKFFSGKLTIFSLPCIYHNQFCSKTAISIVWRILFSGIINFFAIYANNFIFLVQFFSFSFSAQILRLTDP